MKLCPVFVHVFHFRRLKRVQLQRKNRQVLYTFIPINHFFRWYFSRECRIVIIVDLLLRRLMVHGYDLLLFYNHPKAVLMTVMWQIFHHRCHYLEQKLLLFNSILYRPCFIHTIQDQNICHHLIHEQWIDIKIMISNIIYHYKKDFINRNSMTWRSPRKERTFTFYKSIIFFLFFSISIWLKFREYYFRFDIFDFSIDYQWIIHFWIRWSNYIWLQHQTCTIRSQSSLVIS